MNDPPPPYSIEPLESMPEKDEMVFYILDIKFHMNHHRYRFQKEEIRVKFPRSYRVIDAVHELQEQHAQIATELLHRFRYIHDHEKVHKLEEGFFVSGMKLDVTYTWTIHDIPITKSEWDENLFSLAGPRARIISQGNIQWPKSRPRASDGNKTNCSIQ
jgi:hypothetical protein